MIIGLLGNAGSGKSLVGSILEQRAGCTNIALADAMKRAVKEWFGFTDEQMWGSSSCRNAPDKRFPTGPRRYTYPSAPAGAVWVPLSPPGRGHALIDDADYEVVTATRWYLDERPKQGTNYAFDPKGRTRMHRVVSGALPGQEVDHLNGDGLDNRRTNLRACSVAQNQHNSAAHAGATSPFKGVSLESSTGRWKAVIKANGAGKHLGTFATEEEAALAYDAAAFATFGQYARLNQDMFLTPRFVLQRIGTEFGRATDPDVWIRLALRDAAMLLGSDRRGVEYDRARGVIDLMSETTVAADRWQRAKDRVGVAVTDVRFENEVDAIRKAGGEVWRVERRGAGLTGSAGQHVSETEQMSIACDHTLVNDSTIESLAEQIHSRIAKRAA